MNVVYKINLFGAEGAPGLFGGLASASTELYSAEQGGLCFFGTGL